MSDITSKNQICNMALTHLGNYESISDIDALNLTDQELTFATWYDISRQTLLKKLMPNFALKRIKVGSTNAVTPAFGYQNVYEYPNDCLKLLGLNEISERENNYVVEGKYIYTDAAPTDGLALRYITDFKNVGDMSSEFVMVFSLYLASKVAPTITQDPTKSQMLAQMLPMELAEASALNAQENRPVRVSNSRFKMARYGEPTNYPTKR